MIHQELLRRAVPQEERVLQDFVETLAPSILTHLASVPALGGSGKPPVIAGLEVPAGLKTYTAQDYARLTKGGRQEDQSMATHLLNGIFAAMHLAKWLPQTKQLTDLEKRLWILGYICHDYTKIYGIQVSAGEASLIKELNERLGELMNFGAFLPEWHDYLGDISFLAQNTQTKEGSNLQANLFQPKHDLRRLNNPLRILSSIADVLVHVKSPAEVAIALERSTDQNLREKMTLLFGAEDAPRFTYHKLTEVRGLLSNIINNAVMAAMQEQGAEPFLFFPNGVVYIITGQSTVQVDLEKIADNAWERVLSVVTDDQNFGIRRGGTGFVISSALIELIGLEGVLQTAKRKALNINAGYAVARLYGYFTGKSNNDLINELGKDEERIKAEQTRVVSAHKLPDDVRVDQLGEFLTFAYRLFKDEYKRDVASLLLEKLGLDSKITPQDALKQKGGTYFGWYYVAAKYIEANPQADTAQIDDFLEVLCNALANFLLAHSKVKNKKNARIQDFIVQYIFEHLEVHGNSRSHVSFARELSSYTENKQSKKTVCSMCSLPYPSIEQEANETLFVNQQYSNKNPLGHTTVVRGICPVCRIEMILRKIAHPQADEKQKPIFIWVYPTYFFTLETSEVVREFRNRFQEVSASPGYLLEHLHKSGFSITNLLTYERFIPPPKDEQESESPKFSEYDFAGISHLVLRPPKPPKDKKLTETDQWAVPTFHALALPLLLDVKVVATTSFVPLFASGAEFPETTVLDAPHQFARTILGKDRFRVDELPAAVIRLLRLYDLHLDAYGDKKDSHWAQINEVAAAVKTDPLNVFMYYDRKKRDKEKGEKKGKGNAKNSQLVPRFDVERYHQIYLTLGGEENMGIIGKLVDAYAAFYRTRTFKKEPSAYAVVRPLDELINATLKTDPKLARDDLALTLSGTLADVMERIWNDSVKDASDPIIFEKNSLRPMEERKRLSRQKQEEFVELFLSGLFEGLCQGQRATLQENANRYRAAAKFHYLKRYYYSNPTEAKND